MVTGLLGRVRISLASGGVYDRFHDETMIPVPESQLAQISEALDAAQRVIPWVGVSQLRDRLERTLA